MKPAGVVSISAGLMVLGAAVVDPAASWASVGWNNGMRAEMSSWSTSWKRVWLLSGPDDAGGGDGLLAGSNMSSLSH